MNRNAVIVIGNVCSGKTTFCKEWLKKHSEYRWLSLDMVRNELAMSTQLYGNFDYERACEAECLKQVHEVNNILFESVGTSKFYQRVIRLLKSKRYAIHIIKLSCPVHVCVDRYQSRSRRQSSQMPAMYKLSYREQIRENHAKLESVYCDENILVKG